jgi:hypothetical protein
MEIHNWDQFERFFLSCPSFSQEGLRIIINPKNVLLIHIHFSQYLKVHCGVGHWVMNNLDGEFY